MTGFRTYSEFVEETSEYERQLLIQSIAEYHDTQQSAMGGGGGLPGGL